MTSARDMAARWLLAVLLLGGLVMPSLHVVRHAHVEAHQHAEVHEVAETLRAAGASIPEAWLVAEHFEHVDCAICAVLWSRSALAEESKAATLPEGGACSIAATIHHAGTSVGAILVRGPPVQA